MRAGNDIFGVLSAFADKRTSFRFIRPKPIPMNRTFSREIAFLRSIYNGHNASGSPARHELFHYYDPVTRIVSSGCFINLPGSRYIIDVILNDRSLFDPFESMRAGNDIFGVLSAFADNSFRFIRPKPIPMNRTLDGNRIDHRMYYTDTNLREDKRCLRADVDTGRDFLMRRIRKEPFPSIKYYAYDPVTLRSPERGEWPVISEA